MVSTSTQNIRDMLSICATQSNEISSSNISSDDSEIKDTANGCHSRHQAQRSYPEATKQNAPTLFRAIINMMAVNEGGIIPVDHPEFDHAVNDALYGIRINNCCRLVYTIENGLNLVDDVEMAM